MTNDERRTQPSEPSSFVLRPSSNSRADLNLTQIIQGRHVVRRYHDQPVPRALIEQVLEAARWAPSPHGRLPWRFAVLTRPRSSFGGANRTSESCARRHS